MTRKENKALDRAVRKLRSSVKLNALPKLERKYDNIEDVMLTRIEVRALLLRVDWLPESA